MARICELRALVGALGSDEGRPAADRQLLESAVAELRHAEEALWTRKRRLRDALRGASVQRVHAQLDAAEVLVLRAAPLEYVQGQVAALAAYVHQHLVPSDPRCMTVDQALYDQRIGLWPAWTPVTEPKPLSPLGREQLVAAVQGAMAEARNEQMRVRSFRNILLGFGFVLVLLAVGVGVYGVVVPEKLPVCFEPVQVAPGQGSLTRQVVCPTNESPITGQDDFDRVVAGTVNRWDILLVEMLGLVAAAVATATALRKVSGTQTPYSVPATLAFVKLPLGALTALLGLILMRGNFVPGLSALDDSAQIIGWAVVFGYAQQAFTQVVDRKAQVLLDDVGGAEQREKTAGGAAGRPRE